MAWTAQGKCYNDACKERKLIAGQLVCQVALGDYWLSYRTPTRGGVIGEWHQECFNENFSKLFPGEGSPDHCYFCERKISDREEVIYAVRGFKPEPPCVRPEARGQTILFLICKKCMRNRELGRISFWYRLNFGDDIALDELRESLEK